MRFAWYGAFANGLSAIAKKTRVYGFLFDTAAKLCLLLEIKYELGLKTRRAYELKDKNELLRLANCEYIEVQKDLRQHRTILMVQLRRQKFRQTNQIFEGNSRSIGKEICEV